MPNFVNVGVWHVPDFISPLQYVFKNALMFHSLIKLFANRAYVSVACKLFLVNFNHADFRLYVLLQGGI